MKNGKEEEERTHRNEEEEELEERRRRVSEYFIKEGTERLCKRGTQLRV